MPEILPFSLLIFAYHFAEYILMISGLFKIYDDHS